MKREAFEDKLRALFMKRIEGIPDAYFSDVLKSAEWLGVKVPTGGSTAVGFMQPAEMQDEE